MGRTIDEPFVEGFQKQAMGGRRGHLDGGHKQDHSVYRHKDAPASVAPWPRLRATTSLEDDDHDPDRLPFWDDRFWSSGCIGHCYFAAGSRKIAMT